MALVTPSPRSLPGSPRPVERGRPARALAPLEQRSDAPAAPVGEGTRRERVRMDLLVARARAARP
jgi:hypothetical protein